jgi:hypothetical protein
MHHELRAVHSYSKTVLLLQASATTNASHYYTVLVHSRYVLYAYSLVMMLRARVLFYYSHSVLEAALTSDTKTNVMARCDDVAILSPTTCVLYGDKYCITVDSRHDID